MVYEPYVFEMLNPGPIILPGSFNESTNFKLANYYIEPFLLDSKVAGSFVSYQKAPVEPQNEPFQNLSAVPH